MNKDTYELGQRFKYLRLRAGLTQKETAQKLGLKNHTSIFKIETGKQSVSIELIPKICDVLHCSAIELLGLDNRAPSGSLPDLYSRLARLPASKRKTIEKTISIMIDGLEAGEDGASNLE